MLRPCDLARAAIQATLAAVVQPSSRSFTASTPAPRGTPRRPPALRPSSPSEWNVVRRQLRGNVQGEAPQLPPVSDKVLPRPDLVKVHNPAVFTHPSLAAYELKRDESPEEGERRQGRGNKTFERHELLGRSLLDFAVKEMLLEKYPALGPPAVQAAAERLLRTDILSVLATSYDLVASLRADPVAADAIAADPDVQAALFRSYVAGLHLEYGQDVARTWVRKCFLSVINHDYSAWRSSADAAELQHSVGTPLYRLAEFCKRRRIEPQWSIASKGGVGEKVFRAEVEFQDVRAAGSGRTVRLAKQNAAALALKLGEPAAPPAPAEPPIEYTKQLHVYAMKKGLPRPSFKTILVVHPLYECRLSFEGREYVGRGEGKVGARLQAAKAAFEALGVDPKDLTDLRARQ